MGYDTKITDAALERNNDILRKLDSKDTIELPTRFMVQYAHLTCPATVWKYIEKATASEADLVVLDLEDSIPRGDDGKLKQGRDNVIKAFNELDWGRSIRTFRPRGMELDPGFSDIAKVVAGAGSRIEGIIYPKIENADQIKSIALTLTELELALGIPEGSITLQVLIETVHAEHNVLDIARASKRLTGLIFGAFDYWSSLGLPLDDYRPDHHLVNDVRIKIAKAAASVGIPAIAEMTMNYPTSNKTEDERKQALDECRRDSELAKGYGFSGKWTGIPAQVEIAQSVFGLSGQAIETALKQVTAFAEAENKGQGAAMIDGKMFDRATDKINRVILKQALALGRVDEETAKKLELVD